MGQALMGQPVEINFDPASLSMLNEQVFFVTGANTGLGLESCKVLASKGATVVMTYRNEGKAKDAVEEVRQIAKRCGGRVECLVLDLADLSSIKACAEAFIQLDLPLHCLINNAGVMMCPFTLTKDGFEMQFGTNHLGHFALTALLMPVIKATAEESEHGARIVNLTSRLHAAAPSTGILFDNLWWDEEKEPAYDPTLAYGHSKLANIVFTQELAARLGPNSKVYVNSVHPGIVDTELQRHLEERRGRAYVQAFKLYKGALSPNVGALTQLYAALSPEIETKNYRGEYFIPVAKLGQLDPNAPKISQEMRTKLWNVSEQLTGINFDV